MKKSSKNNFLLALLCCFSIANAQEITPTNDSIPKEKEHQLTFSVDVANRYIWRGQSWGGDYPVVQPTIEYAPNDKWTFGIWATHNFKKEYYYDDGDPSDSELAGQTAPKGYQEVDLYIKYNFTKYISLQLWDYYWPSVSKEEDIDNSFFNYGPNSVKTLVTELNFDYTETEFPAHATLSTFIAGNDYYYNKDGEPKQNYTTYFEMGYVISAFMGIKIDPVLGAVLNNKAQYYAAGDYDRVSIVNLSVKASREFKLGHSLKLTPFINYVHNGATKNTETFGANFLVFGITFNRF